MTTAIVATTPQQMQEAQSTTLAWVVKKIEAVKHELADARATFTTLQAAKFNTNRATAMIRRASRRVTFYEKIHAALEAGYVIIPPFDVQIFAVRTDRGPKRDMDEFRNTADQRGRALPVGEGQYVDPQPVRINSGETMTKERADKTTYEVALYENDEWRDADLPVRAHKPQLITAVHGAMGQLIFDALGIAPSFRSVDPIIVGEIYRPDVYRASIMFFVAWWLDEADL